MPPMVRRILAPVAAVGEKDCVEFRRDAFAVRADAEFLELTLPSFALRLRVSVNVDRPGELDRTIAVAPPALATLDGNRIEWHCQSTAWSKRYIAEVRSDRVELWAEVEGEGRVDSIRFFEDVRDHGFRPHFARTKHFNDGATTTHRAYSVGSEPTFSTVVAPEPNPYGRHTFRPHEYAQISVNADLDHCGGNFVANPAMLCYVVAAQPEAGCLAMGLLCDRGRHQLSEFEYLGGAEFGLRLTCYAGLEVDGRLATPRVVLRPAAGRDAAFGGYVQALRDRWGVDRRTSAAPAWWSRPIVCGWGHQCHQADLFRVRSPPEREADNAAYTLSTQATYREITERYDEQRLPWGTLVIDARWYGSGGRKDVDPGRWPRMREFIDALHARGRRVLLWWGLWETDGLAADECVVWRRDPSLPENPAGRLAKFGPPREGRKIAIDPSLGVHRERVREQVRRLLGAGRGCLNADGFKVDHVAAAPALYGMQFPAGSQRLFGVEAAYAAMAVLYEEAKAVKPDCLVVGQSPNPLFADVQDMIRLGDVYTPEPDTVVGEMRFRAEMATIAVPELPIDTDGWPMPSARVLVEYAEVAPSLGVPSLYYATHVDTTGEPIADSDFDRIRRAWASGGAAR